MTLNPDSKYPNRLAYVLKLRSDSTPGSMAGRIENLTTSRHREFSSAAELIAALTTELAGADESPADSSSHDRRPASPE